MKKNGIRTILLTVVGVVFHAPLSVWLGTIFPGAQLPIKAWKEALICVAGILLLFEIHRHKKWRTLWNDWLVRLALAFIALHIVMVPFFWQGSQQVLAGLLIDLRFVGMFVVVYGAIKLYPAWRKPLLIGGIVAAGVSLLFTVLQVTVLPNDILKHIGYDKNTTIAPYLTVDQNEAYVRVNGTMRGPNVLGAYAIIVLSLVLSALLVVPKKLVRHTSWLPWALGALGAAALVALWYSYSRSALVAALGAIGIVLLYTIVKKAPRRSLAVIGGLLVVAIVAVAINWNSSFVQNVIVHENPEDTNSINSNDGHAESLQDGWHRVLTQPFGAGIGSTGSASLTGEHPLIIENQYLFIAHEAGWLGLGVFLALFGAVLYRLWKRRDEYLALGVFASGIGLAAVGLLLPVWADETVAIVWWALAAIALAVPEKTKGRAS
jgi:hypothetical protein